MYVREERYNLSQISEMVALEETCYYRVKGGKRSGAVPLPSSTHAIWYPVQFGLITCL